MARAHSHRKVKVTIKKKQLKAVADFPRINEVRSLMNKILIYSDIKMKAKGKAMYSVLNPETSSDSPSAKSKGVRLVSAKQDIIQRRANIGIRKIILKNLLKITIPRRFIFIQISKTRKRIIMRITS